MKGFNNFKPLNLKDLARLELATTERDGRCKTWTENTATGHRINPRCRQLPSWKELCQEENNGAGKSTRMSWQKFMTFSKNKNKVKNINKHIYSHCSFCFSSLIFALLLCQASKTRIPRVHSQRRWRLSCRREWRPLQLLGKPSTLGKRLSTIVSKLSRNLPLPILNPFPKRLQSPRNPCSCVSCSASGQKLTPHLRPKIGGRLQCNLRKER